MGSLLGKLGALFSYVCIATILAAGASIGYLRVDGRLPDDKLQKILAVLQGTDVEEKKPGKSDADKEQDPEQPSYDDRHQARDLQARNLELREQTLNSRLELVRSEQRTLTIEKTRHETLKNAFKEQLASLRDTTITSGRENVRLIWENIKPKQAKEQILQMLASNEINEVVAILSAMPIDKRAKIVSEFKTPDETDKFDEILRLIREGVPESNLIDKALSQVQP